MHWTPILAVLMILSIAACNNTDSADLLIFNGSVHLMDEQNTVVEAFAVRNGKIVATGTTRDLRRKFTADRSIDLDGMHVFPGLIDAHCHLFGQGEQEMIVDLIGTTGVDEVLLLLKQRRPDIPKGAWLRGRGWDQNDWETHDFPSKETLDELFPDIPVLLVRVDGHAAWVNSAALDLAGITGDTPDPKGGKILRRNGVPTGILLDNAIDLVRSLVPTPTLEDYKHGFTLAMKKCLSLGITGIQDMGLTDVQISALSELLEEKKLPLRVTGYIHDSGPAWEHLLDEPVRVFGDYQLILAGLKLYADGALGSRGALLLEPYSDDPGNRGVQITTKEQIMDECIRAIKANLQVCVHAIGDSAVRLVLDGYEEAIVRTGAKDHRLRIEHAQVIDSKDIPRFSKLGIIASFQPTHCTSDMYWAEARLGPERVQGAYAWHTMRETGAALPFGSDFPVEHPDPLAGIYAACTRQDKDGIPASAEDIRGRFELAPNSVILPAMYEHGWYGSERISRLDAVRGFTSWAAFAARQERQFGTLEPGKYADFIITATDLTTCDARELLTTGIEATFVGGEKLYEAPTGR